MKALIAAVAIVMLVFTGMTVYEAKRLNTKVEEAVQQPVVEKPVGSMPFSFNSATQATTTVGLYAWSTIASADSNRGYMSFCNDSRTANSAIYLSFGATTTLPASGNGLFGRAIPLSSCYEMTLDKMFYGTIYAVATTATSTLMTVKAGY
jgi:hypothetical protein